MNIRRVRDVRLGGGLASLLTLVAAVYLARRFDSWVTTGLLMALSVNMIFKVTGLGRVDVPHPGPGESQVVLSGSGNQELHLIKVIREWSGSDFATAQEMLTRLPVDVGPRMAPQDASTLRRRLVSLGATADIEQRPETP